MCNVCGKTKCCCNETVISKLGERGKASTIPGPPGIPATINIEAGSFTLAADGLSCTGGVIGGTGAAPTITITTIKKLKLLHVNCSEIDVLTVGSYGKDNMTAQDCVAYNDTPVTESVFIDSIIVTNAAGNGFRGKVTAINVTTYVLSFTQVGVGLNLTGRWHAITG